MLVLLSLSVSKLVFYFWCRIKAYQALSLYTLAAPDKPASPFSESLCRSCPCLECLRQHANSLPRSCSEEARSPSQLWHFCPPVPTIPPRIPFTVGLHPGQCNSVFLYDLVKLGAACFCTPKAYRVPGIEGVITKYLLKEPMSSTKIFFYSPLLLSIRKLPKVTVSRSIMILTLLPTS